MSLNTAIQIGRSALTAGQIGLQTTGNNLANAATPGYSRQTLALSPTRGQRTGQGFLGRGVTVNDVQRQVSDSLRARLRASISDAAAARQSLDLRTSLEVTLNELSGNDLSSQFNSFFNAWSEQANLTDAAAVIVQEGQQLSSLIRQRHEDLSRLRSEVDGELDTLVTRADQLIGEVADLNKEIVASEVGGSSANSLRDRRDQALAELAELMDVTKIEQPDGGVDLLVGSTPIVTAGVVRDLSLERRTVGGRLEVEVLAGDSDRRLTIESGRIGALLTERTDAINATLDELDRLSANLIARVNRIHSTGINDDWMQTTSSQRAMALEDRAMALNDPANASAGEGAGGAVNGGFFVHVRHAATGSTEIVRIDIDLDGINAEGEAGFGDDTSAEDLRAALDGIDGLDASFGPDGRLRIGSRAGFEFAFADDSSGVLASLGVNAYFEGSDASSIRVRSDLLEQPSKLQVGAIVDGEFVENAAALGIVELQDTPLEELGGESFRSAWQLAVQRIAGDTEAAANRAEATGLVRDSLAAQEASISGVSLDEESINLLSFQRQYQGAARLITVADEMLQTLLSIV